MDQKIVSSKSGVLQFLMLLMFAASLLFLCLPANAASLDIQPVKLYLGNEKKVEKLTLKNLDEVDFPLQIKAYKWTQNDNGEDIYEDTQDVIIFPKIMTIKKGEERFVRIGINMNSAAEEKAYRIYVEQIPTQGKETEGATLKILMKMGVPLFIAPATSEEKPLIESLSLKDNTFRAMVSNKGNCHFVVTGIQVRGVDRQGKERFSEDLSGWYLLAGSSKVYSVAVPPDVCKDLTNLAVEIKTNKKHVLKDRFELDKTMQRGT